MALCAYVRLHMFNHFTGSIVRSAMLPVYNLFRGRFWSCSPHRGDTLHQLGWNL